MNKFVIIYSHLVTTKFITLCHNNFLKGIVNEKWLILLLKPVGMVSYKDFE